MSNKVNEFEVDRKQLLNLLGEVVIKGVKEGDNWWLPTSDKETIKLIIRERGRK